MYLAEEQTVNCAIVGGGGDLVAHMTTMAMTTTKMMPTVVAVASATVGHAMHGESDVLDR